MADLETRTDAIAFLRNSGVAAWARDWSMGQTIVAGAEPSTGSDGITVWRRMVCIAPQDGLWALYDLAVAKDPRVATGTLGDLCQLTLQLLSAQKL